MYIHFNKLNKSEYIASYMYVSWYIQKHMKYLVINILY